MGYLLISDFSKLDGKSLFFEESQVFPKKSQDGFGGQLGLIGA